MGTGVFYGQWGTMGHIGNGSRGQWGTGVNMGKGGPWAMLPKYQKDELSKRCQVVKKMSNQKMDYGGGSQKNFKGSQILMYFDGWSLKN